MNSAIAGVTMKLQIRADVIRLVTPVLLEQLLVNLLGIVTTIMASRLGKDAASAVGMAEAVNSVIVALFTSLAVGVTVVVAQCVGRGSRDLALRSLTQGLIAGGLLAVALSLAIITLRTSLLALLFTDVNALVMQNMERYLAISAMSYPPLALSVIGCGALRGFGETRSTMQVNTLINLANVVFGIPLIYGVPGWAGDHSGGTGLGLMGAAFSLVLARVAGCAYLFIRILWQRGFVTPESFQKFRPDRQILHAIFSIGIPVSLESLVFNGGKLVVQVMIVGMGTVAIAANYIAFSIANLINIPGASLAIALTTLVGYDIGRGDTQAAERTIWHVLRVAWACMAVLGLVFIPLAPFVVALYTLDSNVIYVGALLVRLNCLFLSCYPTTFVLPFGLKGAGDVRYTLVTTVVGMCVFRLALGYILGVLLGFGIVGVWCGIIVDWFARSILYVIRLRGDRWRHCALTTPEKAPTKVFMPE